MKQELSDFIFYSKYAKTIGDKKETWEDSVTRVMNMHAKHIGKLMGDVEFVKEFNNAEQAYKDKKLIGSQRALQFGGDPILNKNCRLFNCSATYVDRLEVFKEIEWVLLCGCGVGVSVEKQHVDKLPNMVNKLSDIKEEYIISDDIEGWANAIDRLLQYYFIENTPYPKFDYSLIRPNGSYISGGFIAPGPLGLKNALEKIEELLHRVFNSTKKLSPLNCSDIISYSADSVLSGGVRRSAVVIIFDPDDQEMISCKTGTWFYDNPQRGRFNMSAALNRQKISYEVFDKLFEAMREFGEPGIFMRDNDDLVPNPCVEVGFVPVFEGKTGWQFCNLVTINGANVTSIEDFYETCKNAATLATIQASYMNFPFLGEVTEQLVKNDPLIGVSIGGIMCNSEILLNSDILKKGASLIKEQNVKIANTLGIKPSSRSTLIKPEKL